jgi:glutamate-1-semialdehyde 2,1-aminomutase
LRIVNLFQEAQLDYVGSWGPMILGHAHPTVIEAVREAALDGLSFGAPTAIETRVADLLCELVPSMDMVRMVSSGTEATMSAIRLARGFTGRDKIVKFEGCYHGHSDSLLVKAGSGALTLGVPTSPGVPVALAEHTITLEYNNLEQVREAFATWAARWPHHRRAGGRQHELHPAGARFPGRPARGVRRIRHGADLRRGDDRLPRRPGWRPGPLRRDAGPDHARQGGGRRHAGGRLRRRREIMERIAPLGPVYQAGTLSGNPIAMTAGLTTLD